MGSEHPFISDEVYDLLVARAVTVAQFGIIRADGGDAFVIPSGVFKLPAPTMNFAGVDVVITPKGAEGV